MWTILLRLEGPLQAWGTQSRFRERDTDLEPSKSGVLGLAAAALGVPRHDDAALADLAALRMAVRVDRQGSLLRDFHTAGAGGRVYTASGKTSSSTVVSTRYYLADASFLVGLGGRREQVEQLHEAIHRPRWPLCLGRKACVPAQPIHVPDGLMEGTPEDVLRRWPVPNRADERMRLVIECPPHEGLPRRDVPLSFERTRRRFAVRHVRSETFERGVQSEVAP